MRAHATYLGYSSHERSTSEAQNAQSQTERPAEMSEAMIPRPERMCCTSGIVEYLLTMQPSASYISAGADNYMNYDPPPPIHAASQAHFTCTFSQATFGMHNKMHLFNIPCCLVFPRERSFIAVG